MLIKGESDVEQMAVRPPAGGAQAGTGGLVLVGLGVAAVSGPDVSGSGALPPLRQVAQALAVRLAPADAIRVRELQPLAQPDAALTALQQQDPAGGRGWLAPLLLDVGLPLAQGGSWAEALGAWRQPTVLVIAGPQLASGLAAAGAALLERWRVPLLGLLQWGGPWDEALRRSDGLPWLGLLPDFSAPDAPRSAAEATPQQVTNSTPTDSTPMDSAPIDSAPLDSATEAALLAELGLPDAMARAWRRLDAPAPGLVSL